MKIKKILILFLCMIIFSKLCYSIPVHEYRLNLDTKAEIQLDKIEIEVKDFSDYWFDGSGNYLWEISENENTLNYSYFDIEGYIYYDAINPETGLIEDGGKKEIILEEKELFIPYYSNADKISIFSFNQSTEDKELVLEVDISRFAKNLTSPKEKIEEEQEEIFPPKDFERIESKTKGNFFYVLLIIITLVTIVIFLMKDKLFKKKK